MKDVFVETDNAIRGSEAIERALSEKQLGPGNGRRIVSIEGPAGTGKTAFMKRILPDHKGVMVRACETWKSPRPMLSDVAFETNGYYVAERSVHDLLVRVTEDLICREVKVLVFDEADYFESGGRFELLNLARDISDITRCLIILLSVDRLAARFARPGPYTATVTSRLAARVQFRRASLDDALLLAKGLLEIAFEEDLIADCLARSEGSLRLLLSLFNEIEGMAIAAGINRLSLTKWRQMSALSGLPAKPERRTKPAGSVVSISADRSNIA
jgi:DNA transposition AAA+ family ATPase